MNFMEKLIRIEDILLPLEPLVKKLTPDIISSILSLAKIKNLNEVTQAAKLLETHSDQLYLLQKNIKELQQINDLFTRETLGELLDLNSYKSQLLQTAMTKDEISGAMAVRDNIDELLSLSQRLNEIDNVSKLITELEKTKTLLSATTESAQKSIDVLAATETQLAEVQNQMFKIKEEQSTTKQILKQAQQEMNKIRTFNVSVDFVEYEGNKSTYFFNRKTNTLNIQLREGKQGVPGNYKGDKGDPGQNGTNFKIDFFGYKQDMVRYGRFLQGTSFLALDEIPVRIYFKKTNKTNDWTKGQPFGIGCREYKDEQGFVNIVDGLNVDLLAKEVEKRLKKEKQ